MVVVQTDEGGGDVVGRLARGSWRELCEEELSYDPCCRPEWVAAYLRAFEPQGTVVVGLQDAHRWPPSGNIAFAAEAGAAEVSAAAKAVNLNRFGRDAI